MFDWEKPGNQLDFAVIGEAFDTLVKGTTNRADREWPAKLGGQSHAMLFTFALKTAYWTYAASKYLVADKPQDATRRQEFAASVPPLTRTILDLLFNVVFVLDDYPARLCWYFDSGRREVETKITRYKKSYSGDPRWTRWLTNFERSKDIFVQHCDAVCGRTRAPNSWFPHPGKMLGQKLFKNPSLYDFLTYLDEWVYGDLSSSSHGHWSGLVQRMGQVLRIERSDNDDLRIANKYRSDVLLQQMTLLLCLVTEIIVAADFDNKAKAAYLWQLLSALSDEAKDLYNLRYQVLLS
jgi:hypothetical protein